ncbi:28S ribosomal protein S21, mitochondrial-like [Aphidius gifuensis]|uniref:28S ribosomal protein S21, mitochondrial-like n=1 Tax=Aphidius gifuensis TaxID=684658 RepID=UPI001CDB6785|nr:28S ribosomal protein S21, mitochondrial-like [Aphidius gifuensis]XP_044004366.1 28S ribosomal protein S21, mitochondrial-like [Aphidius gifuensis]
MRHTPFISRTVLVKNGNVDAAFRVLNRIMGREGFLEQWRRCRFYEKPPQVRRRVNYEKCKSYYNEDMHRYIQFTMRTNRVDAFPGNR